MANSKQGRRFAESLLAQDQSMSESQFKEYRMHLEEKLVSAVRLEKRMRLVTIVAWIAAIVLPLAVAVIDRIARGMTPLPPIRLGLPPEVHAAPGTFANALGVIYMVTISVAWLVGLVYLIRSRPSLRRARDEYQAVLLTDLQRQIAEMKRYARQAD